MSFSFGGGSTGGAGFSFGAPPKTTASTTAAPTGGFSFGAAQPAAAPAFGAAPGQPAAAPAATGTSFSFGAPSAGSTGASGFSFGSAAAPAPTLGSVAPNTAVVAPTAASAPSFGFGGASLASAAAPAPTAVGATSSFSFGGIAPTVTGGLAAPAPAATAPAPNVSVAKPPSFGASTATSTPSLSLGLGSTATSTAAGGFSFGAPAATSTAPGTAAAPSGGFSFGAPATTTTSAAAAPAIGGFSLPTSSTAGTVASTVGLTLGGSAVSTATAANPPTLTVGLTAPAPATTAAAPIASAAPPSFNLGGINTASVAPTATSTATAISSAPVTLSTTTTTTSSSAAASAASMNYRQLEEGINKWTLELEEQEKVFLNQATQVNAWDRLLMDNGEKIVKLHESVEKVKHDQQRLEHELDFVKSQQSELEEILRPLEASLLDAPPPDAERERIYSLAENMDAQLQRMGDDLREIIEHLNSANRSTNESDPIVQISRVLNAHMDALQWVDQTSGLVQKKLEEVTKLQGIRRKESERIGIL